jgi:hypothetical protein
MAGVISQKGGYQGDSIPPFSAIFVYEQMVYYSPFRNKVKPKFSQTLQMDCELLYFSIQLPRKTDVFFSHTMDDAAQVSILLVRIPRVSAQCITLEGVVLHVL